MKRVWRENGLSIVLATIFVAAMVGQTLTGHRTHNEEQRQHGQQAVSLGQYLRSGHFMEATAENSYSGSYPLARFLYVYVNKAPGKPLDPLVREFARLMLSREGQQAVVKDGYFPIPATVAKEELNKVL